jgi:phosphoribosylaminoimidazolecarboxamide formyltransferase/IMP cyclohydrolase
MNKFKEEQEGLRQIKRALVSVSNRIGLDRLVRTLQEHDIEIICTQGTADYLKSFQLQVLTLEEVFHLSPLFSGRVKTLHPALFGGILCQQEKKEDLQDCDLYQIRAFDLVVVNLYPVTHDIESIDIGGPSLLRAAAKNAQYVTVIHDPHQYDHFIEQLTERKGFVSLAERLTLAKEVFAFTASYDQQIFCSFPQASSSQKNSVLRYGENPHQQAMIYRPYTKHQASLFQLQQWRGKDLSYNNWLDCESAWNCLKGQMMVGSSLKAFYSVCIIKHGNPCGVVLSDQPDQVVQKAWACDGQSAFGSVVACSFLPDEKQLVFLSEQFLEVLILPLPLNKGQSIEHFFQEQQDWSEKIKFISQKKSLRLLFYPQSIWDLPLEENHQWEYRSLDEGFLCQTKNTGTQQTTHWKSVTKRPFTQDYYPLALWGDELIRHYKSNAIAIVSMEQDPSTSQQIWSVLGAGMGHVNRIEALSKMAWPKAQQALNNRPFIQQTLCVSEAFFPFRDVVDFLAQEKKAPRYLLQPGGSIRDQDVIDACDELGFSMGITGIRQFRH